MFSGVSLIGVLCYELKQARLCRLDILGLADAPINDQETVCSEFKELPTRDPAEWYETGLPRRGSHASLPNSKQGSLRLPSHLTKRLEPYH